MIKVQFFIFVLGSVPFIALAEEASSVLEGEESTTTDFRNDTELEELPTLLPTRLQSVTNLLQFGQLMTTESAFAPAEDSDNSTGYKVNTENADGKFFYLFYYIKVLLPPTKQYLENSNTKLKAVSKVALLKGDC